MNLIPFPYRLLAALALGLALAAFGYVKGVTHEQVRRDAIDAARQHLADLEQGRIGGLLMAAKAQLATARANLVTQQKELESAKNRNASLQSDLVAGRRVLHTLVRAGQPVRDPGAADRPGARQLDHGPAVAAELDGSVAAGLAGLADEGDSAIRRLNACIIAYDSLKDAVNAVSGQLATRSVETGKQ